MKIRTRNANGSPGKQETRAWDATSGRADVGNDGLLLVVDVEDTMCWCILFVLCADIFLTAVVLVVFGGGALCVFVPSGNVCLCEYQVAQLRHASQRSISQYKQRQW